MNFKNEEIGKIPRNDSVIQARCKRTTLATILLYFESQNYHPRTLSELIRESLEALEGSILATGFEGVTLFSEATRVFNERRMGNLNPNNRGKKNLFSNLVLEDRIVEHQDVTKDSGMGEMDEAVRKAMKDFKLPEDGIEGMKSAIKIAGEEGKED